MSTPHRAIWSSTAQETPSMPVIEEDVHISRPSQEVFDYLTTPENLPVWDSSVLEVERVTPGPVQVGNRWRGVSKILGLRFGWTLELTELEPRTRWVTRTVEGKLKFAVTHRVEPENGGTRYTFKVEAESGLGGIFGRLADPIVEQAQRRTVRANLDTLAELLTQPSSQSPG